MALSPPAAPGDFPDPFVARVDGGWAAFATNAGGRNVQVRFSADLAGWVDRPDALPAVARWAQPGWTWSPAVSGGDDGWVLWYAVREPRTGRQAISVATAATWGGPYVDSSSGPTVFQLDEGGSIDPSVFRDGDGTRYLVWKADANAIGRPSSLWGARLAPDARTLAGAPVRLLVCDQAWEQPLRRRRSVLAGVLGGVVGVERLRDGAGVGWDAARPFHQTGRGDALGGERCDRFRPRRPRGLRRRGWRAARRLPRMGSGPGRVRRRRGPQPPAGPPGAGSERSELDPAVPRALEPATGE